MRSGCSSATTGCEAATNLAARLIARAPKFAEAYNQRAIALFIQRRFEEEREDCRRVLELNPYHIGAVSGWPSASSSSTSPSRP